MKGVVKLKKSLKKLLSLLLTAAVLLSLGTIGARAREPEQLQNRTPQMLTARDYEAADRIFEALDAMEEANAAESTLTRAERVYCALQQMDGIVQESLDMQGSDRVVWQTEEGVTCFYSTRMEEIFSNTRSVETDLPVELTIDFGTKLVNHGPDVYVIQPFYGIDASFTTQYADEGMRVARTMGGTYYYKRGTGATVDYVAEAIANGGVVIFDSHGDTDYQNPGNRNDLTSGAKTSYLCLNTTRGLTTSDYAYDPAAGTYHAMYGTAEAGGVRVTLAEVDGTVLANHMTKNSNNGLLWAATCLSMATDGIHSPLRSKGLGVMYGYSQSVSFTGDYLFEEAFFDSLCTGKTVAQSIADMKNQYGNWDYSYEICDAVGYPRSLGYGTETAARAGYAAFPIVVSGEDPYPGHGSVDGLQTVKSSWRLTDPCTHMSTERRNAREPSCTEAGYTGDSFCLACGTQTQTGTAIPALGHQYSLTGVKEPTCTEQGSTGDMVCARCGDRKQGSVIPALGHSYAVEEASSPTCTEMGYTGGSRCTRCGNPQTGSLIPALGHVWGEWAPGREPTEDLPGQEIRRCSRCGGEDLQDTYTLPCPSAAFTDLSRRAWYHAAVDYVLDSGLMNGVSDTSFAPSRAMTRAEMAQLFYHLAGDPVCNSTNPFSDVPDNKWYTAAVLWAAEQGIVSGVGAGSFCPNNVVTREQVVSMLYRYAGGTAGSLSCLDSFTDKNQISSWARTAMAWAVEIGCMRGSGGQLNPKGDMTRAEIAQLMMNYQG